MCKLLYSQKASSFFRAVVLVPVGRSTVYLFVVKSFHNVAATSEALNSVNEFLMSSRVPMHDDISKGISNIYARSVRPKLGPHRLFGFAW